MSVVLSLEIRQQGGLSLEIRQNGWTRIESTARPEQNQGEPRNKKRRRKSRIVGGPAGPKIEDWSSIGAWRLLESHPSMEEGVGGCPWS